MKNITPTLIVLILIHQSCASSEWNAAIAAILREAGEREIPKIHNHQSKLEEGKRFVRQVEINGSWSGGNWPFKRSIDVKGDILLGGLHMVHERSSAITCGPIMPQGGVQAVETMLHAIDYVNNEMQAAGDWIPGVTLGAHILDDCDKDTYGLEQAVDFIKGNQKYAFFSRFKHKVPKGEGAVYSLESCLTYAIIV